MRKASYASAIDSLMHAMVCIRPNIAHAVEIVSWYLSNPGKEHWNAVKWILRYLKGTYKLCLCYGNDKTILDRYTDVDMVADLDSKKSIFGYLMIFTEETMSEMYHPLKYG